MDGMDIKYFKNVNIYKYYYLNYNGNNNLQEKYNIKIPSFITFEKVKLLFCTIHILYIYRLIRYTRIL